MAFLCKVSSLETDYQRECLYLEKVGRDADNCLHWFKQYEKHSDFDMDYLTYSVEQVSDSLVSFFLLKELDVA
jgi:hypothetical protein